MPVSGIGSVTETASIAGQSRNSYLGRMKDEYLPKLDDHVHDDVVLPSIIAKKVGTMGGQRSISSFMDSFPQSTGIALFEGDTLPTPRVGTYGNPVLWERTMYMRLRWTGHVERAARKGDAVAWVQPRSEDMAAARKQFELNFARMLYLGPYQPLASVASSTATTSTLHARNDRNSGANSRWKFASQYLRKGMSVSSVANNATNIDAGSAGATGLQNTTERYITAIDVSNPAAVVITVDGNWANNPAANDILVPRGSRKTGTITESASSDTQFAGPNGLLNMIVNSSYKNYIYGLSRTTYPTMEGFVFDNSGVPTAWDEDRIMLAVDRTADDGTGGEPSVLLCHRSIRREYVRETESNRQFAEVQSTKGFSKGLAFTAGDVTLPVKVDRDCPQAMMFALSPEQFGWFEHCPMKMADDGERFVDGLDAHEIVMVKSGNNMCKKPHDNAVIEDIIGDVSALVT